MVSSRGDPRIITGEQSNHLTCCDEKKNRAFTSKKVRSKDSYQGKPLCAQPNTDPSMMKETEYYQDIPHAADRQMSNRIITVTKHREDN